MFINTQCVLTIACRKYVITVLALLAVLHVGSAVQCFQCAEKGTKDASVDCPHICIKHTLAPISIGGVGKYQQTLQKYLVLVLVLAKLIKIPSNFCYYHIVCIKNV